MNNLHPHWQTTDEDGQEVRVIDKGEQKTLAYSQVKSPSIPRAKRGPAALIGIAVFFGIGFALFQGVSGLMGQVVSSDATIIRVTEDGTDPSVVTVQPGKTIRWDNGSTIPHIFESETLPTDDDEPFSSPAVFPNTSFEYTVPVNAEAGTYDYTSKTSIYVKGQIIIEDAQEAAPMASSSTPAQNIPPATEETPDVVNPAPIPLPTPTPEPTPTPGVIPQNPNTVGSGNVPVPYRPLPGTGIQETNTQGSVMEHLPASNTTTGMEVWVLLGITGLSIAYVTRKAVRDL